MRRRHTVGALKHRVTPPRLVTGAPIGVRRLLDPDYDSRLTLIFVVIRRDV
jgi:hypothetical protein